MRSFARKSIWGIMLTLLTVFVVAAQTSNCTALLEDALLAVENNCDSTGRNEACYGYNQVSASFLNEVSEDFFTQPSDISQIADIETIRTAGLDLEAGIWGVAMMNIQANLPNTLPGQSVTFMLLGDVEVENGVDPATAFQPSEGIEIIITPSSGANIRSGAGLNYNVVGGARPDETFLTDGVSEDGEWFRVAYNDRVAWINRLVFDDTIEGIEDLPVLTDELQTPMQAFYLRTGVGQPECEEVPDNILMVQGPEGIEIDITANGADITIGSTLGLRIIYIDGEPFLEVIAFAGEIEFMGVRLLLGQSSHACLGESGIVTCDATPAAPAAGFGEDWCILEQLPANLLNYSIEILCPGETPPPPPPPPAGSANNNGGASTSNIEGIDCSTLSLISPLGPVDSGNHTFSWNAVEGEGFIYQLVFYNFEGAEAESFWTSDTSYSLNLGQETSTGGSFSWDVRVYGGNGEAYACVSAASPQVTRTGDLNPPAGSGFSASIGFCGVPGGGDFHEGHISWSNAPSTPVMISWVDTQNNSGSPSYNTASGNDTIWTDNGQNFTSITVSAGGESISLGGC